MRIFRKAVVPTAVTTAMLVGSGVAQAQEAGTGASASLDLGGLLTGLLNPILSLVTGLIGGLGI